RPPIIPPPWTRNHFPQVWDKAPDAGASGTLSSRMGAVESALLLLFLLPGAGLLLRGSGLSRARVLRTLARRGLVPRRRLRTGCGCGARLRSAPGAPAVVSSSSTVTVPPAFAAVPAAADDAAPWFWPLPGRTGFTPTLGARAFCSSRRTRAASSSSLAIFSNSRYCWPAVHRLLVTMYTRMAIGQNAPVTRMPTGNAHSISWFMILACGLAAAWGDWRDREIRAFTWVVTAETIMS